MKGNWTSFIQSPVTFVLFPNKKEKLIKIENITELNVPKSLYVNENKD